MKKQLILGGLFAATLLAPLGAVRPAFAHEAPCPYCGLTITQDTPTQDNEVALKIGRKRIEYKCVFCALAEARTEYKGDLTILAPSEKKGEPVQIKREGDKWSVLPTTAVFVSNEPLKHKVCQAQARAFSTPEAAKAYIAANKESLPNAQILPLDQMVKVAAGDAAPKTAAPDAHAGHEGHTK